ncbi:helix-turn-helix domain-containing protein [Aeoliella sp. SH292]|uniref:helix-turn-helix domain-containing protein n=1 Tax=Aeoliella sp. SH292 TaxID=3454464 RepID=UPI003F99A70A
MSKPSPADALIQFRQQQASRFAEGRCESLVGDSPAMKRIRNQVAAAAASGANVLVRGRDAAQLADIAQAIHYRRYAEGQGSLWTLDAAEALPNELSRVLQSIARAEEHGTLVIESIDRLLAEQQAELLTHASRGEWRTPMVATLEVGDDSPEPNESTLSDELMALLTTLAIEVPPLASRPEDIPALAPWFLDELNRDEPKQVTISTDSLDLLMLYPWPGELTELRDVVAKAHVRARGRAITPRDLPRVMLHAVEGAALATDRPQPIDLDAYLSRVESTLVLRALELAGGNKAEAARLLGVSRPRLYRKLEQMGLVEPATLKERDAAKTPLSTPPAIESPVDEDEGIEFLPVEGE